MTPSGWKWALLVWGYALAWVVINDLVKLAAYRIFDASGPGLLRLRHR
jgi:H+-transporting ATPase